MFVSHVPRTKTGSVARLLCAAIVLHTARWLTRPSAEEVTHGVSFQTCAQTEHPLWADVVRHGSHSRTTVYFDSHGYRLQGWLYEPHPADEVHPAPLVIMAHGMGGQKDMGLQPFAEQFAQAGVAALTFDYRGWGGSEGTIRHHVSWRNHMQDWQAALDFVTSGGLPARINSSRVALWGTSYSGGHVLMTASKEENKAKIAAVVANIPFLGSLPGGGLLGAVRARGVVKVLRLFGAAVMDKARASVGLGPVYVKLVGSFQELAILNMDAAELAIARSAPPVRQGCWTNLATARTVLEHLGYKPINHVHKISAPTLLVGGVHDVITPIENIRQAAQMMGDKAQLLELPWGHLEMRKMAMQPGGQAPVISFLHEHLHAPAASSSSSNGSSTSAGDTDAQELHNDA